MTSSNFLTHSVISLLLAMSYSHLLAKSVTLGINTSLNSEMHSMLEKASKRFSSSVKVFTFAKMVGYVNCFLFNVSINSLDSLSAL